MPRRGSLSGILLGAKWRLGFLQLYYEPPTVTASELAGTVAQNCSLPSARAAWGVAVPAPLALAGGGSFKSTGPGPSPRA